MESRRSTLDVIVKWASIILVCVTLVLAGALAGIRWHPKETLPTGFTFPGGITIGQKGVAYGATPDYVCDGVNDQVDFDAAEVASDGGVVQLLPGAYSMTSWTCDSATFQGFGPEYTTITCTGGIIITGTGDLNGVEVNAADCTGTLVSVAPANGAMMLGRRMLEDVWIHNGTDNGTGLKLVAAATSAQTAIGACNFGPLYIDHFHYGLWLYSSETGAPDGWINGNTFEHTRVASSDNCVVIEAGTGADTECHDNTFVKIELQPHDGGGTGTGVSLIGADYNDIHMFTWDWGSASSNGLQITPSSNNNHIWGGIADIDDDGVSDNITSY